MIFDRRTRRLGAATLVAGALGAAALAVFPGVAAGAVVAVTTVSCSVTGSNWCISGNNTSSGIGVIGTSKTGTALRGTSTSQYGLKATSGSNYAILAQTTTGVAAISASSQSGYGVYGFTTKSGIGLYGSSPNGYGVYGSTTSGSGYGLVGVESGNGTGLYGSSISGDGAQLYTSSGYGLYADATGTGTGAEIFANSGYGLIAHSASKTAATLLAQNTNGNASDVRATYIALLGRTPAGGFPIVATDPTGADNLFYVDGSGNVSYKGGLFHISAIGRGLTVKSFTPNATEPTIEDTGTARLVNGAATVRLDGAFADSIETGSEYRVFVTPNGDTRGLFVATKTPAGFIVHEAQGGRSSVTFDYRIVATALGHSGQRMALTSDAYGAGPAPRASAANAPAAPAATRVKAAPALPAAP